VKNQKNGIDKVKLHNNFAQPTQRSEAYATLRRGKWPAAACRAL